VILILNYEFNREWLIKKFEEIQIRILKAIEQLNNDQLNWQPNNSCASITMLVNHIVGNINERIQKGILHNEIIRNRHEEFNQKIDRKEELQIIIKEQIQFIINTVISLTEEQLEQKQQVRARERLNIDMLHQCAAHYSEHMGQIFYIAKLCLGDKYKSTSI
jgi:uncharacterized damage-inducible protein DinB